MLDVLELGGHGPDEMLLGVMILIRMVLRVGIGFVGGRQIRVRLLQLHVRCSRIRETRQRGKALAVASESRPRRWRREGRRGVR